MRYYWDIEFGNHGAFLNGYSAIELLLLIRLYPRSPLSQTDLDACMDHISTNKFASTRNAAAGRICSDFGRLMVQKARLHRQTIGEFMDFMGPTKSKQRQTEKNTYFF